MRLKHKAYSTLTIAIDSGLYRFSISGIPDTIKKELETLYGEQLTEFSESVFYDFSLSVQNTSPVRRYFRRQRVIAVEGVKPFNPISERHLLPSIEWAMNWAVAAYQHTRLSMHSSVVVKNNKAIIIPASSGSGKSTLATLLGYAGWQMFSDEMALIDIDTLCVNPLYRPSSLKNKSIEVVSRHFPEATISSTTLATHKGDIAHARVHSRDEFLHFKPVKPVAVVFLKFVQGSETSLRTVSQTEAFAMMLRNAFNYNILGNEGFSVIGKIAEACETIYLEYSDVDDVDNLLTDLVR